jgi:hypothetical protein
LNQDGDVDLIAAATNGNASVVTLLLAADVTITNEVSHMFVEPDMHV